MTNNPQFFYKLVKELIQSRSVIDLLALALCYKHVIPFFQSGLLGGVFSGICILNIAWIITGRIKRASIVLFFIQLYIVLGTWPDTINHRYYELYLSVIYLIVTCSTSYRYFSDKNLAQLLSLMLASVWLMAALQKVFHGYYLNGSMLIFWFPPNPVEFLLSHVPSVNCISFLQGETYLAHVLRVIICVSIVAVEILAAYLCLKRTAISVGIVLLLQFWIALFSGEWDFAMIAMASTAALHRDFFYFLIPVIMVGGSIGIYSML